MDGTYTKIPNEILEMLYSPELTPSEKSVVAAVARKTFGFGKEQDNISISQLQKLTSLPRSSLYNAVQLLGQRGILLRTGSFSRLVCPANWRVQPVGKNVQSIGHTKETITKQKKKNAHIRATTSLDSVQQETPISRKKHEIEQKRSNPNMPYSTDNPKGWLEYDHIWKIAHDLAVPMEDVKLVADQVQDSMANGNKYRSKNTYLTTRQWVRNGIQRKQIEHLDEMGMMILENESPELLDKRRKVWARIDPNYRG